MYRTIEVMCLMVPGRRRVLSCHSRDIGYLVILSIWIIGIGWRRKRKWRPAGERLASSVSVKDRSLSGPVIEFGLY